VPSFILSGAPIFSGIFADIFGGSVNSPSTITTNGRVLGGIYVTSAGFCIDQQFMSVARSVQTAESDFSVGQGLFKSMRTLP